MLIIFWQAWYVHASMNSYHNHIHVVQSFSSVCQRECLCVSAGCIVWKDSIQTLIAFSVINCFNLIWNYVNRHFNFIIVRYAHRWGVYGRCYMLRHCLVVFETSRRHITCMGMKLHTQDGEWVGDHNRSPLTRLRNRIKDSIIDFVVDVWRWINTMEVYAQQHIRYCISDRLAPQCKIT